MTWLIDQVEIQTNLPMEDVTKTATDKKHEEPGLDTYAIFASTVMHEIVEISMIRVSYMIRSFYLVIQRNWMKKS